MQNILKFFERSRPAYPANVSNFLIKIQFSKQPLKTELNLPNISRISKECTQRTL